MRKCRTERIMDSHKLAKLHKFYSIILAVLACLTGVGLLVATLLIYFTGDAPHYTREIVGRYLLYLTPLFALLVLGLIGGLVLDIALPLGETKRPRADISARVRVKRMYGRVGFEALSQEVKDGLAKEGKRRKTIYIVLAALEVILLLPIVLWLSDISHFTFPYKNADVVTFFLIAIPLALVGIALLYVAGRLCDASWERELNVLKEQAKVPGVLKPKAQDVETLSSAKRFHLKAGVRVALLTIGVAFVVLGIFNGGAKDVFDKAVKICMECIGLG